MAFLFRCPHCGFETTIDDQFLGWTGPCKSCQATITMNPAKPGGSRQADRGSGGGMSTGLLIALIAIPLVLVGLLAVGGVVVAITLPAVQAARGAARAAASRNNMKQIGIALHMYHEKHGSFPPAVTVDESGRKMHSWRVILLPDLAAMDPSIQPIVDAYNFDEPWDSPANRPVAEMIPSIYRAPQDSGPPSHTSYLWLTGLGTPQPGNKSLKIRDIVQGTSNTPMIAEVVSSGIAWTEPRDTDLASLRTYLANQPTGGSVAFYDASVLRVTADDAHLEPMDY